MRGTLLNSRSGQPEGHATVADALRPDRVERELFLARQRELLHRAAEFPGLVAVKPVGTALTSEGDTTMTHPITGGEVPGVVMVDEFGHILGSRDTYHYNIASAVHVAAANTVMWDMFNADATLLVRVLSILQIPNITTAVTGITFDWLLERTTSAGTGGTAQTAWLPDTSQTSLDADVTCRLKPSGAAAQSTDLRNYSLSSEETNAATIMVASLGGLELVPPTLRPPYSEHGILLRQNQGLRCVHITNSVAGNTGWLITFTVE